MTPGTNPVAFFDRDGTLIEDLNFDFDPRKINWCDGAIAALKLLREAGWKVGVITNQSGVARGFCSEDDVHSFHDTMLMELAAHEATIDFFEYCPFHKDAVVARYRHPDHPDRKPNPGMILRAIERESADVSRSFLIGDRETDLQAASRAGIRGLLYDGYKPIDALVRSALDP